MINLLLAIRSPTLTPAELARSFAGEGAVEQYYTTPPPEAVLLECRTSAPNALAPSKRSQSRRAEYLAQEHNVRIWKFTPGGPGAIGAGVNSWFGRLRSAPESAIRALVIDFNEALGTAANAHALPQIQGTQLLTGLRGPERSGQGRSRRTRESRTRFAA